MFRPDHDIALLTCRPNDEIEQEFTAAMDVLGAEKERPRAAAA
ncbi:hypothetical protein BRM3_10400 [Brachybacterium huguangmaarense]|uniref:Uncharacterized protein n=1 Tax=Brachybacterium huguangmaarense TaxID=1652028 RepID=A0ABY6FYM8_9MICO|nr:hypothetical protein [Brachybacterium huguangmaarense]UYG16041.1 hypothetical protein BRM3_10400 [Brachybacterium huguangmaarense]